MVAYYNGCECGKDLGNNCAHYLSNWMIGEGIMSKNPGGAYCCAEGRPIRAKEMRNVFVSLGYKRSFNEPSGNAFIYVERQSDHQGHVYYGTKDECLAGTGDRSFTGESDPYTEYYTK